MPNAKIRFIKNLAGYTIVASILISPVGLILLLMLPFIRWNKWCANTWIIISKLVCNLCHSTGIHRTISGWTGQHITKPRYKIQARFIDSMFGESHCVNAFEHEKFMGWVDDNSTVTPQEQPVVID